MSDYSLLPDNRSALERGLELAFTQLLYESQNPYPAMLDPRQTGKAMLPYLAQDRGVSEWDANAPESEQRQTVANAWPVRRLAGTRAGLSVALSPLDAEVDVVPWYESGDEPYHLSVVSWVNRPITAELTARVIDRLSLAKSERDILTLGIGVKTDLGITLSTVSTTACIPTVSYYTIDELNSDGATLIVAGSVIANAITVE